MQNGIKNALLNSGAYGMPHSTNAPYSGDDLHQYYADETKTFFRQNLQWSSTLVRAQVQGIDYSDFYKYTPLNIRTANLIDPTTGKNLGSDWQRVIVEDTNIDFLPRGAKIVFNGNVWLVTNPMNVQSVTGTSVMRRCNAVWHYLDYYGNVKSEPFCYGQGDVDLATGSSVKEGMILMDSYQHCVMQLNPETEVFAHNMRLILGRQAYSVRGVQDFVQEFTLDEGSTHIQFFDLEIAEPLAIDDLENKVAGGKTFRWEIRLSGAETMPVGATRRLTAQSYRSEDPSALDYVPLEDEAGRALQEKLGALVLVRGDAVDYLWESSDETVLKVDESGNATAIAEGTATVRCRLKENPAIFGEYEITVSAAAEGTEMAWDAAPPKSIAQYQSVTMRAVCRKDGETVTGNVTFAFSGPVNGQDYTAEVNGNSAKITCWLPSETPLTVTAAYGNASVTAALTLKGW